MSLKRTKLVTSKSLFTITLLIIVLTILCIWFFGLGQHRTIFENSLLSTSILSIAFFLFLTIGLYRGVKLKDNLGKITENLKFPPEYNIPDISGLDFDGDGLGGFILGIIFWLIATFVIALLFWFFGAILWIGIVIFIAMLYWIFFRALRLVFKNSNRCRGKLLSSVQYGIAYTLLYNCWIYAIIFIMHYISS